MNDLNILLSALTLLYYETSMPNKQSNNSNDDVMELLKIVTSKKTKVLLGGIGDVMEDIKDLIKDYITNPLSYNEDTLLEQMELILKDRPEVYRVFSKSITKEMSDSKLKRAIITYRNKITTYIRDKNIANAISKVSYTINTKSIEGNLNSLAVDLINQLEELTTNNSDKDAGIVDEIDIDTDVDVHQVLEKVKEQNEEGGRLKTGWKKLNTMLGGGFRLGEMVMTSALQHNYKSGLLQSLFAQLPVLNKPKMKDPTKKPLMVLISFEDDAEIIVNFIYNYLWYDEFKELPDLRKSSTKEMAQYIKRKLSVNGYSIKILRVNPSEWTYKDIINKTLQYESEGYELHAMFIDYLSKLPTTGCIHSGPTGTDLRDLFNRIRNFFSAKNILVLTAHQLSSDAKQILRNDIPAEELVKKVANKGYYEGSKQLDQVVDLEIHQHIAYIKKVPYLTFQRGKRRFPEIIPEDKKYFMLKFPKGAPIPSDINSEGSEETPEVTSEFDADLF